MKIDSRWGIAGFVLLIVTLGCASFAPSQLDAASLTPTPMVGPVTDTTAMIWIRADSAVSAVVQYQPTGGDWSQPSQSSPISLVAAKDFTAIFTLAGLSPLTTYDYRVLLDGVVQANGGNATFKTFLPAGTPGKFSFVFGADIHPGVWPHTTFSIMGNEQTDFAVLIGDLIYHTVQDGLESTFWSLYKANRDVNFQNFAMNTPIYSQWDNADYGVDDTTSADSTYVWRDISRQARVKYWPLPPLVEPNGSLHYKFSVGDCDFFILDTRWNRVSGVTMLGATQLQWLEAQLLASTAKFKFIFSTVMVSDFGTTGGGAKVRGAH